jgi:hypothetical protein
MSARQLRDGLTKLIDADPNNTVWDDPIEYGEEQYVCGVDLEDVTDECDGSCENPQCIYAAIDPDIVQKFEAGEAAAEDLGYMDEGLHYRVRLDDGY